MFAVLSKDGKTPVAKEKLNNNILKGILFGPEALLDELREDMILTISSLSVGCRNIVLSLSLERLSEKCLCEYFMLYFL